MNGHYGSNIISIRTDIRQNKWAHHVLPFKVTQVTLIDRPPMTSY